MVDDTYQGWTNRETWCVSLWLNNEEGLQQDAQAACNVDGEMLPEAARSLEEYVDDLDEVRTCVGFAADLINASLARVNWVQIAQSFRDAA